MEILFCYDTKINTSSLARFLLSELVLQSELLNGVLEGKEITPDHAFEIYQSADSSELFQTAQFLRKQYKTNVVTFSKKAFFNIVNLCKDTCSYCTYKAEPNESKAVLMTKEAVRNLLDLSKRYRCVEALLVTGERPELKYKEARSWLRQNGFATTVEYLSYCSQMALQNGLFPHTNAGNLYEDELKELKQTNVSMGLMLESSSERLARKNFPHYLAPSKNPKTRIGVLECCGRLKIPITTGILVGIGETIQEIIDSLFTIKQLHDKYHHIQEIILQNFQPKEDTPMKDSPPPNLHFFKKVVALARIMMPKMNIQIPPNLSPSYQEILNAGINDWGGISPLTPDYVNPEFPWPEIRTLENKTNSAGFELKCRFPVYPEFIDLVPKDLRDKMNSICDEHGFVKEEYWR